MKRLAIAHQKRFTLLHSIATFASIATLITVPAAVLIARYFRSRTWWFKAHVTLQCLTLACLITLITLSTLAVASVGKGNQFTGDKPPHPHHDLGLSTFILVFAAAAFGVAAHNTSSNQSTTDGPFPTIRAKKSLIRRFHACYGVLICGVMYATIRTGMNQWNKISHSKTKYVISFGGWHREILTVYLYRVPYVVEIIAWVIMALEITAYVVGWVLEGFHGKQDHLCEGSESSTEEKAVVPPMWDYRENGPGLTRKRDVWCLKWRRVGRFHSPAYSRQLCVPSLSCSSISDIWYLRTRYFSAFTNEYTKVQTKIEIRMYQKTRTYRWAPAKPVQRYKYWARMK